MKITTKITADNLPKGPYWDKDGACYEATKLSLPEDWYWRACNEKALAKGYCGQELFDYYPIVEGISR